MAQHSINLTPYYVNMVEPNEESASAITAKIYNKKFIYSYLENVTNVATIPKDLMSADAKKDTT